MKLEINLVRNYVSNIVIFQCFRLVPFVAVCSANSINIPMMRRLELTDGVELSTEQGQIVGHSKTAARQGIGMVVLSRIGMAAPGMVAIPFFMNYLENKGTLAKYPRIVAPLQVHIFLRSTENLDLKITSMYGIFNSAL